MADYIGRCRTNYFHVTDEAKFREIIGKLGVDETPTIETEKDENGSDMFMFLSGEPVCGYPLYDGDDELAECDWDSFVSDLQSVLAENDACIITEIGYEKFRYLVACADVITKNDTKHLDLNKLSVKEAADMLSVDEFDTRMDY